MNYIYSTGKRKKSVARVYLKVGTGIVSVNGSYGYIDTNFKFRDVIFQPLKVLKLESFFDFYITVNGGGITGQAEAIRHGISKALLKYNFDKKIFPDSLFFKKRLKDLGFLTRDSRKVERKKVGRRKARKKEQYSKR